MNKTTKTSCVVTYSILITFYIFKHNGMGISKKNSKGVCPAQVIITQMV
jgi:hypothetical protein